MKTKPITRSLLVLVATAMGISDGWSDLSGSGRRLESQYRKQFEELKEELEDALPTPDKRRMSEYLAARKAETAAGARLKEAQERHARYGKAQGMVAHAKGKWIGGAEKGIAQASEQLKNATTATERRAAEEALAKWEKNKEEGLEALEERQKALDEAKRDRPKAEQALADAREALAAAKARTMESIEDLGLEDLLSSDAFDGRLARYVVMNEAGPQGLAEFAGQGREEQDMIDRMLADEDLLMQMAVADGAKGGNYGRAMEIYHGIREASPQSAEGTLQRLALAISLEHAAPVSQRNAVADTEAPATVDPVKRYLQYEKAFLGGRLDPAFANLEVWDYRMVVDGSEPDEILVWGREMLRNYRPDHITMDDYRWRYVALVRSDIRYGSDDNQHDKDELQFFQNILMNGGVCGRRAFIGRFILRAFGIPTTARPQRGHAALAHWTPKGWVVCLGGGWGAGWTKTPYGQDRAFLATTQARATGGHYLRVKRAHWIGDVKGEKRSWGFGGRHEPGFWNGIALYAQGALIEAADAKELAAVGEDIAEANVTKEKIEIAEVQITEEDRKIRVDDGVVRIPAAATTEPTRSSGGILFTESTLGGKQLHYSRNSRNPEFEYAFRCRDEGKYALVARVATPSWQQNLMVTVNGAAEPVPMPLPHTVGMWEMTDPVAIELKHGRNVLRFRRHSDGHAKGITIKEFMLIPWDRHLEVLAAETAGPESAGDDHGMSPSYRGLLEASLLRGLARLSADGTLEPLPMDLSITSSKVRLLEAKGSGILAIQAVDGEKIVAVALEDLALEDHALLARLVARLSPGDPTAAARAGVFMEALGNRSLAADYQRQAGPDAYEQFVSTLGGAEE